MTWYYNNDGVAAGPYDDEAMKAFIEQKLIQAETLIWHPGAELWQEIKSAAPAWWPGSPVSVKMEIEPKPLKADGNTTRSLQPMAPRSDAKPKSSGGFLKRLFGFGGKK